MNFRSLEGLIPRWAAAGGGKPMASSHCVWIVPKTDELGSHPGERKCQKRDGGILCPLALGHTYVMSGSAVVAAPGAFFGLSSTCDSLAGAPLLDVNQNHVLV